MHMLIPDHGVRIESPAASHTCVGGHGLLRAWMMHIFCSSVRRLLCLHAAECRRRFFWLHSTRDLGMSPTGGQC